jgi:nucleotide-binding universal stress UspA family protein
LHKTDEFPADAILETAREQRCDCIFLASHGHRRRHGPTLGSQTQKVASEARVPGVIYKVEAAGS